MLKILMAGAFIAAPGATAFAADTVANAYALCKVIDGTGMTSKPCEVSGWNSTVVSTIDMTTTDAQALCRQIVGVLREKGLAFDDGWTLQIRSPYSGENSIAFCPLPS